MMIVNVGQEILKGKLYVILLVIWSSVPLITNTYATDTNNPIYPVGTLPSGKDHRAMLAEWWKATFQIPEKEHPMFEPNRDNPNKCILGNDTSNNVLFLVVDDVANPNPTRTCNIPAGFALFLPIESGQCDYGYEDITNDAKLTECAKAGNEGVEIQTSLDGKMIAYPVAENKVLTDFFNVTFAQPSIFGMDKLGPFKSQAEGYTLFLKPLTSGNHKLVFDVSVTAPLGADDSDNYAQKATYNLIAK